MIVTNIEYYTVLYGASGGPIRVWLRAGNDYIGQAVFLPDEMKLPDSTEQLLFFHQQDYPNIIDLLRNEKPTFLMTMETGDTTLATIMTGTETVGEGEIHEMLLASAS